MKTRNIILLTAAVILATFTSCSSLKVFSDYDKEVDFTQYKTIEYLGWSEGSEKLLNDLEKKRIETAFSNEFAKRNMEFVENDADLVVSLFLVLDQKTTRTAYTSHYGGGFYRGYYGYGHATTSIRDYDYVVGTLIIDVFDAKTKQLVWQGIGKGTVDENPQTVEKNIPKTVARIMERFPLQINN